MGGRRPIRGGGGDGTVSQSRLPTMVGGALAFIDSVSPTTVEADGKLYMRKQRSDWLSSKRAKQPPCTTQT